MLNTICIYIYEPMYIYIYVILYICVYIYIDVARWKCITMWGTPFVTLGLGIKTLFFERFCCLRLLAVKQF